MTLADISQEMEVINSGQYGDDVKEAIISAIEKLNAENMDSLQQLKSYLTTVTPLLNKFTVCPSGTITLSENGSYDVADYDMATVDIPDHLAEYMAGTLYEYVAPDGLTSVRDNAFARASFIRSVAFPEASIIGASAFLMCTSLQNISFPLARVVSDYAFWACSSLVSVTLPECKTIYNDAFAMCTSLETINLPMLKFVSHMAFNGCSALQSIFLSGNSVPTLASIDAFPMDGSYTIYIRAELLSEYLAYSIWNSLYQLGRIATVSQWNSDYTGGD